MGGAREDAEVDCLPCAQSLSTSPAVVSGGMIGSASPWVMRIGAPRARGSGRIHLEERLPRFGLPWRRVEEGEIERERSRHRGEYLLLVGIDGGRRIPSSLSLHG